MRRSGLRLALMSLAAWALLVQTFALGLLSTSPASAEGFVIPLCSGRFADGEDGKTGRFTCACCFLCTVTAVTALPTTPPPDPTPHRFARFLPLEPPHVFAGEAPRLLAQIRARGPPAAIG